MESEIKRKSGQPLDARQKRYNWLMRQTPNGDIEMTPTNQEATPSGDEHYKALETIIKNLTRRELESVALRFRRTLRRTR